MFQISGLPLLAGQVGLCPLPGRGGDYEGDLDAILAWRPQILLTLTSDIELEAAGAETLPADLAAAGVAWHYLPVCNLRAPCAMTAAEWPAVSQAALAVLACGGRVLAHCYGGRGRAGMVLMRLMVDAGEAPEAALQRLRAVEPCAVESAAQFAWAGGEVTGSGAAPEILVAAAAART